MNYFVGDLARFLNLSGEMIRYYEKMGTLKPDRQQGNNYRIYSAKDILALVTVMQLQSFQIKIKDIYKMSCLPGKEYTPKFLEGLSSFRKELIEELEYKNYLLLRVNEVLDRDRFAMLNVGSFWTEQRFAHYRYPFLRIDADGEPEILLPEAVTGFLFSEKIIPFCDFTVEFIEKAEQWNLVILEEFGDYLKLPADGRTWVPSGSSVRTVVNGSQFSPQSCAALEQFAKENQYQRNGIFEGLLCCGMPMDDLKYNVEVLMSVTQG